MSNPDPTYRGKPQKMTDETGQQKGLKQVLEERGFDVLGMRAKCKLVWPFENQNCCMARFYHNTSKNIGQIGQKWQK